MLAMATIRVANEVSIAYEFPHRLINTRKAAEIAGVTERTIRNWIRLRKVEFLRLPTRGVRIYADTLLLRSDPED